MFLVLAEKSGGVALKGASGNDALFQGTAYADNMYGLAGDDGIRSPPNA